MKVYSTNDLTVGPCHCPRRQVEQQAGRFFYTAIHKGYIFPDREGINRRVDGRPFVWVNCPWCGGDLMTGEP